MSVKSNNSVKIDREAMEKLYQLALSTTATLEGCSKAIGTSVRTICDDEEFLSGADTKDFKTSLEALQQTAISLHSKYDQSTTLISKLSSAATAGIQQVAKPLDQAKEEMAGALMKMRQVGK